MISVEMFAVVSITEGIGVVTTILWISFRDHISKLLSQKTSRIAKKDTTRVLWSSISAFQIILEFCNR